MSTMRESQIKRDPDGGRATITPPAAEYTIVFDMRTQRQVIRMPGLVVLPVGAEIELMIPDVNVKVQRVRLLSCSDKVPVCVSLDVEVPPEYWRMERV